MEQLFNPIAIPQANNSINVNSHPLYNTSTKPSNYTLFNNMAQIPSPIATRHPFYVAPPHPTHHHRAHSTQLAPNISYMLPSSTHAKTQTQTPFTQVTPYTLNGADYYIPNRQIPINMNVSYKTNVMNHHNHNHNHHLRLIHAQHLPHCVDKDKQQQQQQQINVHYHFHDPLQLPSLPSLPLPPIPALTDAHSHAHHHHHHHHHHHNHNHNHKRNLHHMQNHQNHHNHIITPYLPSTTPNTVPRSSSIASNACNPNMNPNINRDDNNTLSKLSHREIVFFEELNHKLKRERQRERERERKLISFPSGDRDKDKYIGLKRIGAGTFADIWEVYDQTNPKRKHWAIKVLKKSKCLKKSACKERENDIDHEKYIKYTNAMIAEGNRILRLNKEDKSDVAQIIECKEILKCVSDANSIHQHSYDNNIGPCVVLELMGISLLQYTQLYEKNKLCIPLVTVRCIAIQLFNALSFLHGVGGYIHADLKPENVLITLQHSINGNLMNNKYPNIKIVDLGNALSYNRNINTFEVQSLYYRAPEVLFGNEMTSRIDLWSTGCILFELININKFNQNVYLNSKEGQTTSNTTTKSRRHHHALFACCNRMELAQKIHDILTHYPEYVYNKYNSFYLNEINNKNRKNYTNNHATYSVIKELRKNQLMKRLVGYQAAILLNLEEDSEYIEFVDLIACLLDLNPATRYSSEDAVQHPFCIKLQYIENDINLLTLLSTQFHSTYPQISISNDFDRQLRINQQIEQYQAYQGIERNNVSPCACPIPVPKEMATTKKCNAFGISCSTGITQTHNKVICLLNGCCRNPTVKKKESLYTILPLPPLKKMKYNDFC